MENDVDWFEKFCDDAKLKGLIDHPEKDAVFDFRGDDIHTRFTAAYADAVEDFTAGQVKLPFDRCFFMVKDYANLKGVSIFHVINTGGKWDITLFIKHDNVPQFSRLPFRFTLNHDGTLALTSTPRHQYDVEWLKTNSSSLGQVLLTLSIGFTLVAAFVLAEPRSHTMNTVIIPKAKNILRSARNKARLPPVVRVVNLAMTWLKTLKEPTPDAHQHINRESPCGHMRKGYTYSTRRGTIVVVPPTVVCGGPGAQRPPMPRVVVKHESLTVL